MVRYGWIAYIFVILSQQYADGLEEGERGKEPRKFSSGVAVQIVFHFLKWENWQGKES